MIRLLTATTPALTLTGVVATVLFQGGQGGVDTSLGSTTTMTVGLGITILIAAISITRRSGRTPNPSPAPSRTGNGSPARPVPTNSKRIRYGVPMAVGLPLPGEGRL